MSLLFHLIDSPFVVLGLVGWAALMGLEVGAIAGVVLSLAAVRWLANDWQFHRVLGPVDRWRASANPDEQCLRAAEAALARAPRSFGLGFATAWVLQYVLVSAWVWWVSPATTPIGAPDLLTCAAFLLGTFAGGTSFAFHIGNLLIANERRQLSRAMSERDMAPAGQRASLSRRLALSILGFVIAPIALIGATGWSSEVGYVRARAVAALGHELDGELARVHAGEAPEHANIVDAAALAPNPATAATDGLPPLRHRVVLDRRSGGVQVAASLGQGRWLLVESHELGSVRGHGIKLMVFCGVLGLYAVFMALIVPWTLSDPLRRLETLVRRLVEVGDIGEFERAPVLELDEVGSLTHCVNDLVVRLQDLAGAAGAVADGDLSIELSATGELSDAFRGMLGQLRVIVSQIRETAVEVSTTAAEILAATQAQEAAALALDGRVDEIGERLASLAAAANRITDSAAAVLDNAEQTLGTTDGMIREIAELSAEAEGIAGLISVIREIAARSDLLALNGSLEATRAGEAGRGFALVAGEMRRLAERVTQSVGDARERVDALEHASASTVHVTESSRRLANDTAATARQISELTQEQSDDTAHVSANIHEIGGLVGAASAATTQTRAAAQALHVRVEELERVTRHFELRELPEASAKSC